MKQISLYKKIPRYKQCTKEYTKWSAEYFQNIIRHQHIFPVFYLSRGFLRGGATGDIPLKQLGSTTLGSSGTSIASPTISAQKYLMVEYYVPSKSTNSSNSLMQFNSDSGSHYATRYNANGGTDNTSSVSATSILCATDSHGFYMRFFIVNIATQEKLLMFHSVLPNTAGAANAPSRYEEVAKWTDTTNPITLITINDSDTLASGSTLTVYGAS